MPESWSEAYAATPERDAQFTTLSGEPIKALYTPADVGEHPERIGLPGQPPFTRGVYPSMYRGRLWTMRQFAGFGTAEETNERFHYLLDHGQTGLSTAFDMPSLMGLDSDSPRSLGEVGREGVALDTLDDMRRLFEGIDLGAVSVSMTINAPAAIMLAYYVVAAELAGVPASALSGTIQADILKEYIAQKEWCFPIDPAMRLLGDMVEWCTAHTPRWHPISISGYHIREAGSTAAQELAFTLKDGFTYLEQAIERGLAPDDVAPRLSFFFNAQIDFFEEIAKYRAARRIWARELRETYGARDPRSWLMRFHTQTAGVSLTAQQPLVNIARTAIEALAGVLGGTQSLHTNSFDEALALPTEDAARVALRTQQVIAHETGVTNTIDPLGGSYFVEALTDHLEALAYEYFARIDALGGMVAAVKQAYPQREIADAAYRLQQEIDSGRRVVVGVNGFVEADEEQTPMLRIDPGLERKQIERLQAVRASRDGDAVETVLGALRQSASRERENLMPGLIEAARVHASEGEIVAALQDVWGDYREAPVF
ncbi:MAG TPA: methylmalonyl-CoA mutase family protein [Solirubrobacteraceae bacterium]